MAAQVNFPELDIRQRLTVSAGYGLAELHIPDGSSYVGNTLAESGLHERDLNVLSLVGGLTVVPNPKAQRELEANDRLLCFGRLDSMRDLIPASMRRKRCPRLQPLPEEATNGNGQKSRGDAS